MKTLDVTNGLIFSLECHRLRVEYIGDGLAGILSPLGWRKPKRRRLEMFKLQAERFCESVIFVVVPLKMNTFLTSVLHFFVFYPSP